MIFTIFSKNISSALERAQTDDRGRATRHDAMGPGPQQQGESGFPNHLASILNVSRQSHKHPHVFQKALDESVGNAGQGDPDEGAQEGCTWKFWEKNLFLNLSLWDKRFRTATTCRPISAL